MSQEYPKCPRCDGTDPKPGDPCAACGGCGKDVDAVAAAFWLSPHGEAVREAADVALATFVTAGPAFAFAGLDEVEEFTEGDGYAALRAAVVRAWPAVSEGATAS